MSTTQRYLIPSLRIDQIFTTNSLEAGVAQAWLIEKLNGSRPKQDDLQCSYFVRRYGASQHGYHTSQVIVPTVRGTDLRNPAKPQDSGCCHACTRQGHGFDCTVITNV